MPQTTQHLVPAVDRAIRMLATLQDVEGGRGISDLARALGIPKSSAHQIAATLLHHRVLERDADTQHYRLGPGLAQIAARRPGKVDLPTLARPYLEELAAAARMTALLGLRAGDGVVLAAKVESPEPIDVSAPLGHRLDLRTGAFGKLFAAALSPGELDVLLQQPLPIFTAKTIRSTDDYRQDLRRVRKRGYALDLEEYLDGIVAVGAAVRGSDGEVVGGICLIGLAASYKRRELRRIGATVHGAAESLSYDLGFERQPPTEQTGVAVPPGGAA